MALLAAILIAALPVWIARFYWRRVGGDGELTEEERIRFRRWVWLGTIIPVGLWVLFNLGLLGQPVWPTVVPISGGLKAWHQSFNLFSFTSTLIISSYWAGVTFVWLFCRMFPRVRHHRDFTMMCGAWSLLLVPIAILLEMVGGWWPLGLTLLLTFLPLVHMSVTLKPDKKPMPSYARALAKISFGKYDEAEKEVIRQLEQFEEDFDGWMMLAELYATQFSDLGGAHETVRELCAQPSTTPVQVSIALHRLADWHLKFGRDPVSARAVLEDICTRMPGTHLDRMARQRIEQLPASRKELEEREAGKPLRLPQVPDELQAPLFRRLTKEQALAEANQSVEALRRNPDDAVAREEFARVLADNLGDATTAIEQLQLLLAMPNQPPDKRAQWLFTIAGWHARHRNDLEMALLVCEQVARDFPNTPHAFAAQCRIHLLTLQLQIRRRAKAI